MSAAWAIRDREGHLLPGLVGASRFEVGRKILTARYDPFRLHVSASYREMFERDLGKALTRNGWQIVRVRARHARRDGGNAFMPTAAAA